MPLKRNYLNLPYIIVMHLMCKKIVFPCSGYVPASYNSSRCRSLFHQYLWRACVVWHVLIVRHPENCQESHHHSTICRATLWSSECVCTFIFFYFDFVRVCSHVGRCFYDVYIGDSHKSVGFFYFKDKSICPCSLYLAISYIIWKYISTLKTIFFIIINR